MRRTAKLCLCALGLVAWSGIVLAAQDVPVPTLHVYANLIQIPVLVLNWDGLPLDKPIEPKRFHVSVDSGAWFQATHVRQEGDDPISLTILLDVRGDVSTLMPKMNEAIATLPLHPRDHVSIYALSCGLVKSLNDVPADPALMKKGVDVALNWGKERGKMRPKADCKQWGHIWDALNFATHEMEGLPGRRVILAVTDGNDTSSAHTWNQVRAFAQSDGVAIFGVTYTITPDPFRPKRFGVESPLRTVCELSGGVVFDANGASLADKLQRFITMVRQRYIVEFPRPNHSTAGYHGLDVKVDKANLFIRPAGIAVPLADPAVLADPTTVPSDPSHAPDQGKRQILPPPK